MKSAEFELRPWDTTFVLVWNCNSKQFAKFVRRRTGCKFKNPGMFEGITWEWRSRGLVIVGLQRWRDEAKDYQVLTHEIFHATFFVMRRAGVKLCDGAEESFCYSGEEIMRKCLKRLNK